MHVLTSSISFVTDEAIARQWETAEAECEDVADGICMTIILPNLHGLKVVAANKNKIEIDATRMVHKGGRCANRGNSGYLAEFKIEGDSVSITNSDLSYEYCSETGLLHVYTEKVRMEGEIQPCNNDDDEAEPGVRMVDALKRGLNGFTRYFRSGSESK